MIESYKGRMITHSTEVFAYRNLHRDRWSIKALSGPHKGKVVGHADEVVIVGCQLKVSEAGRQRVIAERKKNVHAGVVGTATDPEDMSLGPLVKRRKLSYNPYKAPTFTVNEVPVQAADYVHLAADGKAYAYGTVA
ncbi:hypothetical protein PBI_RHYNO_70 [Mycobacterium phage RhynO]|uniref:hypothetical protein n=1 Tax=Mycobacterium phage RhynO TaxID=1458846 RepID=UPI0003F1E997|nr:hypothetical protein CG97_gp12 [Mycobacterium phage RhynO]AHJ88728.1 hypothetical protein PBI_RHYNO_70 [Mycobacterium phage RhynO]